MTIFGFSLLGLLVCLLITWQHTLLDPISLLLEWLEVSLPAEALPHLYELLEGFIQVSAQGVALAVLACGVYLIVRRLRCSKTVCLLLWAVVALRLFLPVQIPSPLSLFNLDYFNGIQTAVTRELDYEFTGDYDYTVPGWKNADAALADGADIVPGGHPKNQHEFIYYYEDEATGAVTAAVSREDGFGGALALVWVGGMALLLGYSVASYGLLKRRLRFAVKDEHLPWVWYSDRISSPCVVGFLRPKIYLTFGLSDGEKAHILAHERQHIKNGDHIWKLLAWLVVCLHWMTVHPLLLLLFYSMFLLCVEEACDQRVLRLLGEEQKADYSQSLLSLSTGRRFRPGPSPIAFGEGDTEDRIHSILRYKKPLAILTALALVVIVVLGITIATNRVAEEDTPAASQDYTITDVVCQTSLSSSTDDYFLEQSLGTTIHLSPDLFSIEGEGFVDDIFITDPVYRAMDLEGGTLPNFISTDANGQSKEPLFQIPLPEGARGWQVIDNEVDDTGYHVFVMDGYIWIGKWVSHGTVGSISEYWYILRADLSHRVSYGEPGNDENAAPTATLDPAESAPAETDKSADTDWDALKWSDTVIYWSVPLESLNIGSDGFAIPFHTSYDQLYVHTDGGCLKTTEDRINSLSVDFTTDNHSLVFWMPFDAADPYTATNIPDSAVLSFTLRKNGDVSLYGKVTFQQENQDNGLLTYSVRFASSDTENFFVGPTQIDGFEVRDKYPNEPGNTTLSTLSADLTHDGVDEIISVCGDSWTGSFWNDYYVIVRDASGKLLWYSQASTSHAGQNGIYLYEEQGKHYLMVWCNYGISGFYSLNYRVFYLGEPWDEVPVTERAVSFERDDFMAIDTAALRSAEEESRYLLNHSIVLVSTNGDTPDGQYYSTPEDPIAPIVGKSMWGETPSADYFDELQSKAQGTYTFQGEVVSILEEAIMVADESLWAEEGYGYCFTIPVDDPTQFQDGDNVQVTADGPLYRHQRPDKGTSVTVEPIT